MANRPVFYVKTDIPYFQEELVSFEYNAGFSVAQKKKNIVSIHNAFCSKHRNARLLEISSKSDNPVGIQLSAFNLQIKIGSLQTTVESAFQAGKVFRDGGPFTDLLLSPSHESKKDLRLQSSGPLCEFNLNGVSFPLEPKTFFYDWLYLSALLENEKLARELCKYNSFTDIEFNPKKSISCQARSAAIFVSLSKLGKLEDAMKSPILFEKTVYGIQPDDCEKQLSLF